MKIGVMFFPVRAKLMLPMARHMDALGYESAWTGEHLVFPTHIETSYPYGDLDSPNPDTPLFDPLLSLAFVAAQTKNLRIGTSIYIPGLRHPLIAAKLIATLDNLSGGRVLLGIGAGWLKEEFDAADAPWDKRGLRMEEAVAIMRRLWTEERIAHDGRFYQFPELGFQPKPVQSPLPVILGGETELALKRAARIGDGWLGLDHTPESAAERVRQLTELRGDAPPLDISIAPHHLPDLDEMRRYRDAGLHRVVLRSQDFAGADRKMETTLDNLSRFAEEVMNCIDEG